MRFSLLALTLLALISPQVFANPPSGADSCEKELIGPASRSIETLDELLSAFSSGFIPDLSDPAQRDGFEIYRRMRFGDPNTSLNSDSLERVSKKQKKHSDLTKTSFRDFELIVQERRYPVTDRLKAFAGPLAKNAGQARSSLFQIEANLGYWKKVFQYDGDEDPDWSEVPKDQKKSLKKAVREKNRARFLEFLDERIPEELRKALSKGISSSEESMDDLAKQLYEILAQERERMRVEDPGEGQNLSFISQAIVDLIHTIGFHDASVSQGLKSKDGLERVSALRRALSARDSFAMSLGFDGHFVEALTAFEIDSASGVDTEEKLMTTLFEVENDVISQATMVEKGGSSRTVRHLSLIESPFRSCLGGSDCSSRNYLTRAMDPNYHYFTLTDDQGFSSGHITVVLGDGKQTEVGTGSKNKSGPSLRVAFIDKIQNVPHVDLPDMIEAVRRSMEEQGYLLCLPENLGDENGLSNEAVTRDFVKRSIRVDEEKLILHFQPHSHAYSFPEEGYSRAGLTLAMRPVLPLELDRGVSLVAGEITQPWRVERLDLNDLVAASYRLKDGTTDEKLRYIPAMQAIEVAGLAPDPAFHETLMLWLNDPALPLRLRKQVLIHQWLGGGSKEPGKLSELLTVFGAEDRITVLSNLLDTPRYRDKILKKRSGQNSEMVRLMVLARSNKKVSGALAQAFAGPFAPRFREPIEKVLRASDIADERIASTIKKIKSAYTDSRINGVATILSGVSGTSVESWFLEDLERLIMESASNEIRFSQSLVHALLGKNEKLQEFGRRLLNSVSASDFTQELPSYVVGGDFLVLKACQQVDALAAERDTDFREAALEWIGSFDGDPSLKADFILSSFGASFGASHSLGESTSLFEALFESVSDHQREVVIEKMNAKTNLITYWNLAKERGISMEVFEQARLESFHVVHFEFPGEGVKFWMGSPEQEEGRYDAEGYRQVTLRKNFGAAATTVTQFQYYLVTGKLPSNFKRKEHCDGDYLEVSGDDSMCMNHPVERVSWEESIEFAKQLSQSASDGFEYEMFTEARWEFVTRGGTQSRYSFGDDERDLSIYGWTWNNSKRRTHAVASLKANPFGLFDTHGNVLEWVSDRWTDSPDASDLIDPEGPSAGSTRVLRGGSCLDYARDARSAYRFAVLPGNRNDFVGLRLLRRAK